MINKSNNIFRIIFEFSMQFLTTLCGRCASLTMKLEKIKYSDVHIFL